MGIIPWKVNMTGTEGHTASPGRSPVEVSHVPACPSQSHHKSQVRLAMSCAASSAGVIIS